MYHIGGGGASRPPVHLFSSFISVIYPESEVRSGPDSIITSVYPEK
jgi:hypothetical protein